MSDNENKLSLFDIVYGLHDRQARKHQLGVDYAENYINEMTNVELLRAISDALEGNKMKLIKRYYKNKSFSVEDAVAECLISYDSVTVDEDTRYTTLDTVKAFSKLVALLYDKGILTKEEILQNFAVGYEEDD